MPNYGLVINSRFRPFSYAEMLAPVQQQTEAHQALEEAYGALGTQAGTIESMLNRELDRDAYNQYQGYMKGLQEQADILAKEGLSPSVRNSLMNMRQRYGQEIIPIQKAAERREKLAEEQRKLGPGYAFEYDASTTGLDKFMNNPTFTPKQINLAEIRQRSAAEFGTLAKQLRSFKENPNMYRKGFDSTVLAEYGYSPENAARVAESIRRGEVSPEDAAASAIYNSIYGSTGVNSWSNNLNTGQQAVRNAIAEGVVGAIGQMTPQIVTDRKGLEDYKYEQQLKLLEKKAEYAGKGKNGDGNQGAKSILKPLPAVANQSKEQKTLKDKIDRYNELLDMINKNPAILEAQEGEWKAMPTDPATGSGSYYESSPNYKYRKEFEDLHKELLEAASKAYPNDKITPNYSVETVPQTVNLPYSNAPLTYANKRFVYDSNLGNYLNDLADISRGYEFNIDPEAMENIMEHFDTRAGYSNLITDEKGNKIHKDTLKEIENKGWKYVRPYIKDGKIKFTHNDKEYTLKPQLLGDLTSSYWDNVEGGPRLSNLWDTQQYALYKQYLDKWAEDLYLDANTRPIGQTHTGKVDVYQFDPYEQLLDED